MNRKKSDHAISISVKCQQDKWSYFLFYLLGTHKSAEVTYTTQTHYNQALYAHIKLSMTFISYKI